jgi:predicted transposase YdaD
MQLVIAPDHQTAEQAKQLIQQVQREQTEPYVKQGIIELITTITIYKFTHLSRQEVEAMIGVRLEETRVYQEAKADGIAEGKAEGIAEGKLEEGRSLILRQLNRRIDSISLGLQAQIQDLSLGQIEALSEALLDFSKEADLVNWLQDNV